MCTVVFAGGTDENPSKKSEVAVVRKDESTFKVYYKTSRVTDVKVSIFNSRNQLLFTETVKRTEGFVRPYNFGNLAEGDYTFSFLDESGKQSEKISYRFENAPKLMRVVKLSGNEGKYLLTASGKGNEEIILNIYDGSDQLVYNSAKLISGDYAEVYNLAKIKGSLTFEIMHENGEVEKLNY